MQFHPQLQPANPIIFLSYRRFPNPALCWDFVLTIVLHLVPLATLSEFGISQKLAGQCKIAPSKGYDSGKIAPFHILLQGVILEKRRKRDPNTDPPA